MVRCSGLVRVTVVQIHLGRLVWGTNYYFVLIMGILLIGILLIGISQCGICYEVVGTISYCKTVKRGAGININS